MEKYEFNDLNNGELQMMKDHDFDWTSFQSNYQQTDTISHKNNPSQIPNIVHFVFGLQEQTEEFLFCYYLAIVSANAINSPDELYLHYHFPIYGKWWDKLREDVPNLKLHRIYVPTHIGTKKILKTAHKADKARMDILWEKGGIYMDIDTISIRPYHHLLRNDVVLGKQFSLRYRRYIKDDKPAVHKEAYIGGICNAIMMTKPRAAFFKLWLDKYEEAFEPTKWEEASIFLPYELSIDYPEMVTVVEPDVFFMPTCFETDKIFETPCDDIPPNLLTLHLTETFGMKYIEKIKGWEWGDKNRHTMYAKFMKLFEKEYNKKQITRKPKKKWCIVSNNCYGTNYYRKNKREYDTPFVGMFIHSPDYIKLLDNFEYYMSIQVKPLANNLSKYSPNSTYPIGVIDSEIEIHFIHDNTINNAIEKWERRKLRMPKNINKCIFKLCDRDGFTKDIGQRFCSLPYKHKILFVCRKNHENFNEEYEHGNTKVFKIPFDETPDGVQLESNYSIH
jgi:uncharacterized protein (DUF1919 family)